MVDPGTYVVINHSTDTRYENVQVTVGDQAKDTFLLERDAEDVLTSLCGYQAEQLSVLSEEMVFEITSLLEDQDYSPIDYVVVTEEGTVSWPEKSFVRYQCAGGGTVEVESEYGLGVDLAPEVTMDIYSHFYRFN